MALWDAVEKLERARSWLDRAGRAWQEDGEPEEREKNIIYLIK